MMNVNEALKIVRDLAEGIDPRTGDPVPEGSPSQQPPAIRALFVAATELERRRGYMEIVLSNVANSDTPISTGLIAPLPTKYSLVDCARL